MAELLAIALFTKATQLEKINPTRNYQIYKFALHYKSKVGVKPQAKIGTYYIDRTKEYKEKYPDKNILKVTEEQKVKCSYNN